MRPSAKLLVFVCLLAGQAIACSTGHVAPQVGTETGNPPIIDQDLVALVVSANELRIVGKAGAVRPGGSTVQVISALTGMTFKALSAADGSFDVLLDASPADTFELRALLGSAQSRVVYVVRGGAAVGDGSGQTLSCKQREALATAQMNAVVAGALGRCRIDTDCTTAALATACSESCSTPVVSKVDALQVDEARAALEEGLCSTFAADGCSVLQLPCPSPPFAVRCVEERCVEAKPIENPDCSSAFDPGTNQANAPVYWFYAQGQVCLPRVYNGQGGNGNRYYTRAECEGTCRSGLACPPNRGPAELCVRAPGVPGSCEPAFAGCALLCSSDADCKDDPVGNICNAAGACESSFLEVP